MFKYNLILKYKRYSVIAILFMLLVLSRYVILKYDLSGSAWRQVRTPPPPAESVELRTSYDEHLPFRLRHLQMDMSSYLCL